MSAMGFIQRFVGIEYSTGSLFLHCHREQHGGVLSYYESLLFENLRWAAVMRLDANQYTTVLYVQFYQCNAMICRGSLGSLAHLRPYHQSGDSFIHLDDAVYG